MGLEQRVQSKCFSRIDPFLRENAVHISLLVAGSCWQFLVLLGLWLYCSNLCLHLSITFFSMSAVPLFSFKSAQSLHLGPTLNSGWCHLTIPSSITSKWVLTYSCQGLKLGHIFFRNTVQSATSWLVNGVAGDQFWPLLVIIFSMVICHNSGQWDEKENFSGIA